MNFLKKNKITILGYLISALFLYLTFKDTNFGLIVAQFRIINPLHILVAALFNFAFFLVRGLYQINNLKFIDRNIAYRHSLTSIGIAQFYNIIFPARLGEVIRIYFLSRRTGAGRGSLLSYIFIEKIMDFLVILAVFVPFVLMGFGESKELAQNVFFLFAFLGIVFVGVFVYIRLNAFLFPIVQKALPEKIALVLEEFNREVIQGFQFFKSVPQFLVSLALLLLSWSLIAAEFWFISYEYVDALGLPVYTALFLMIFASLAVVIPGAPSGIGIVHYALAFVIGILGEGSLQGQENLVAAFVIILHFFIHIVELFVSGGLILYHRFVSGDVIYDKVAVNETAS